MKEIQQHFKAFTDSRPVNHEPDSSTEQQRNTPEKTMPFSDQIGNYQRNKGLPRKTYENSKVYIIGTGVGGMAVAYYLIRDGQVPAKNITFIEQLQIDGGSLDGAGNPKEGYIIRGGREMDMTYENLWDMFQDIPALELPPPYSVLDEYRLVNDNDSNYSKARLIHKKEPFKTSANSDLARKINSPSSNSS